MEWKLLARGQRSTRGNCLQEIFVAAEMIYYNYYYWGHIFLQFCIFHSGVLRYGDSFFCLNVAVIMYILSSVNKWQCLILYSGWRL